MKRLRYVAIALLFGMIMLLGIERMDLETAQNLVNIQTFVYILTSAAVLIAIAFPATGRIPLVLWWGAWSVLYLVLKLSAVAERPLVGGIYTYLTIAELSILSLLVVLAQLFSREINQVQDTLAAVILPDAGKRAKPVEEAVDEIEREFARSRRNNLLLSLLIVQPDSSTMQASLQRAVQEAIESFKKRYLYNSLLQVISKEMRRTDLVLEQVGQERFIVLLPDTGAEAALMLQERIRETAEQKTGIRVLSGCASFPQEALTLEEMVQIAEANLSSGGHPTTGGQPTNGYHAGTEKALSNDALASVKGEGHGHH